MGWELFMPRYFFPEGVRKHDFVEKIKKRREALVDDNWKEYRKGDYLGKPNEQSIFCLSDFEGIVKGTLRFDERDFISFSTFRLSWVCG
jgi:hypothetical protein